MYLSCRDSEKLVHFVSFYEIPLFILFFVAHKNNRDTSVSFKETKMPLFIKVSESAAHIPFYFFSIASKMISAIFAAPFAFG